LCICAGPEAVKVLQEGVKENLSDLYFMNGVTTDVFNIADVRVTRCGYTGEDGFEVMDNSLMDRALLQMQQICPSIHQTQKTSSGKAKPMQSPSTHSSSSPSFPIRLEMTKPLHTSSESFFTYFFLVVSPE
jgi:hypothetical protein